MARLKRDSFAWKLRELRTAKGLTKYRLAQLTGLSQQALSNLELDHNTPSFESVIRLAAALGVSTEAFVYPLPPLVVPPVKTAGRPRKEEK